MKVLGIDPGTARVGWAVIESKNSAVHALSYGCITTNQTDTAGTRLMSIYTQVGKYCKTYKPDVLALEELYFATNAKTVIPVGQARGVILLVAAQKGISVVSYSPLTVKRTITGDGKADKSQMQRMVQLTLKLKEIPKPDDTADAIAIALTHVFSYKMKRVIV